MARLRRGQVIVRQHLGIERVIVAKILLLEFLAVNLVFVGKFVALGRIESVELAHGLGRQRLAVHEEQDAPGELAFQQPVNLRHREKGFSRPGGQRQEEFAQAGKNGSLGRGDCANLIRAQPGNPFGRSVQQPGARGLGVEREKGTERG